MGVGADAGMLTKAVALFDAATGHGISGLFTAIDEVDGLT